jgi:nucleotide-binding universal stress UspA family protein
MSPAGRLIQRKRLPSSPGTMHTSPLPTGHAMSALRSILVHLDASPRSARRLALAGELAARHGAQVTALYATTPAVFGVAFALDPGAGAAMSVLPELDSARRDAAKARFDRSASAATMRWQELRDEPPILGVADAALYADLLVLGQHDAADAETDDIPSDFVPSVLLASGRPALVIPYTDAAATFGQEALIAWKPTRASARAVSAAIPLLRQARRLHLTVDAGATPGAAESLEGYLRLHGVAAPIQRHGAVASASAGDGLLSLAADVGADLLVMGCYGHSRARELVLGGASRTVLKSMTLPVLMAH